MPDISLPVLRGQGCVSSVRLPDNRCAQANRALSKDRHRVAYLKIGTLGRRDACESNIGQQYYLFISQFVANSCQVCLGVWHQRLFRLGAVDGVSELRDAEWSATRPVSTQTEITLSAWGNCAHQDTVSNFISGYAFARLVDDAHRFMADDQARFDPVFASQNVELRAANGGGGYANYRLARS